MAVFAVIDEYTRREVARIRAPEHAERATMRAALRRHGVAERGARVNLRRLASGDWVAWSPAGAWALRRLSDDARPIKAKVPVMVALKGGRIRYG